MGTIPLTTPHIEGNRRCAENLFIGLFFTIGQQRLSNLRFANILRRGSMPASMPAETPEPEL